MPTPNKPESILEENTNNLSPDGLSDLSESPKLCPKKIYQKWWFWLIITVALGIIVYTIFSDVSPGNYVYDIIHKVKNSPDGKIDDWQYEPSDKIEKSISAPGSNGGIDWGLNYAQNVGMGSSFEVDSNIGFSTGGAKDINNFRENINNNYLPIPTDITYEGLFYDYYFDTGQTEKCNKLFCPSYSYAVSPDPLTGQNEYYLSVGLNSGIKESDFSRKKLNLVVVLDISGSMSSPFNQYYYDQFGNKQEIESYTEEDKNKSKMAVAAESVVALVDNLEDDDRFGMVLFDDKAYLGKPLSLVGETDMDKIKEHILSLAPMGGTRMSAGMKTGTELFNEFKDIDYSVYENRMIFLTDAMPNLGDTSEEGLLNQTSSNADNNIYTTFIGIGVDFNTELIESITKVKGANYYSVHSSNEFKTRMDDEFEYMVTPLVFNLVLSLEANGYQIEKVYGSPEANEATGEIMKVNTLFPSKTQSGQTRGGVVLLKLKKLSNDASLILKTSYEDRSGATDGDQSDITIDDNGEIYQNSGIRKAILLTRYANMIKAWIEDERKTHVKIEPFSPCMTMDTGIIIPPVYPLGQWERQSLDLTVSEHYQGLFKEFKQYFIKEKDILGDQDLSQERDILDKLTGSISIEPKEPSEAEEHYYTARKISDIKQIQTALELYYVDHNGYPNNIKYGIVGKNNMSCISDNGWDSSGCSNGTIYMRSVPQDEFDNNTVYSFISGGKNEYYLLFNLTTSSGGIKSGLNIANPSGIKHISGYTDSDQDELPDEIETIIGTSNTLKDTDKDGYLDGEEVKAGYDPTGPGIFVISI